MLTRTQTKHQIINHINGCRHYGVSDTEVDTLTDFIMAARENNVRITTKYICMVITLKPYSDIIEEWKTN